MNKILNKGFVLFGILSCFAASATATLNLEGGDTATIQANALTNVSCNGDSNGGTISCDEGCQQWYNINTYVNGSWQNVPTCAFQTKCEFLPNRCVKATTCAQFQTISTYINSYWQDVVSCAGTQSKTTCN